MSIKQQQKHQQQKQKHLEMEAHPRPQITGIHEFHIVSDALDDSIRDLEMHANMLTDEQNVRLQRMLANADSLPDLTVNEIDKQYHLFLKIQDQVIGMNDQLRATASVRDIAAVISSMGSLISLFLKAQKELDSIKAEADLKEAVLESLKVLPESARIAFFTRMSELEG